MVASVPRNTVNHFKWTLQQKFKILFIITISNITSIYTLHQILLDVTVFILEAGNSTQCTTKASHSIAFLQFVTMWPWPFVWPNINCWARSWWTISVPSLAILVSAVLVLSCRHTHTHTESDAANRLTRAVCLESQTSTKKLPQGRVNMLRATKWGPSCLSQTFPSQNGPCMEMPISTAHSPQLDTSRSCNPQTRDQCIV